MRKREDREKICIICFFFFVLLYLKKEPSRKQNNNTTSQGSEYVIGSIVKYGIIETKEEKRRRGEGAYKK